MRVPVTVTNLDKKGKLSNRWHVRIGSKWQTFDEQKWLAGGVEWVKTQLKLYGQKDQPKVG